MRHLLVNDNMWLELAEQTQPHSSQRRADNHRRTNKDGLHYMSRTRYISRS